MQTVFHHVLQTSACPSQFQQTFFLTLCSFFFCVILLSVKNGVQDGASIQKKKKTTPPPILPLLSFSHPLTASSDFISFLAPLLIFSPFYLCSFPILLLNSESATMSAAEATSKGTQGQREEEETQRDRHTPLFSSSHISSSHNYLMQIRS